MVRWVAAVMVAVTVWVQQWAELWSLRILAIVGTAGLFSLGLAWCYRSQQWVFQLSLLLSAALLALTNSHYQAQQRLAQQLPAAEENQPFKLVVQIEGLARLSPNSRYVTATVLQSHPAGAPKQIALVWARGTWRGPYVPPQPQDFPELIPGQHWAVTAYLKTPHGARNPAGFDYEGYVFAQGIRAIAQVRGEPQRLASEATEWSLALWAQRARYGLRQAMLPYLESLRWGGVVLALSIGDQASIHAHDWRVFNRTGLTHLVSISGSHVTLLASVCAWVFAWGWRRLAIGRFSAAQHCPAPIAAAWLAWIIAGLYSLIAGWEVPARRTFFMFSVVVVSLSLRLPLSITVIVAWAVIGIVLFDPWSVLASGFWLSFGAVLLLVACAGWTGTALAVSSQSRWRQWWGQCWVATQWQLVISLALLPPLAFLFFEMSLVSPLSNAYGIPMIGLVITPLSLLFALCCALQWDSAAQGVLQLTHFCLELTMAPTQWLAQLDLASLPASRAPAWVVALAMVGVGVALWPKAWRWSVIGWGLLLPALFWRAPPLAHGEWRLHVLDVGQGSAVVIETARHVFLYDTGIRRAWDSDEGERTVVPYLHSLGKQRLDALILSHADLDHVGGSLSVIERLAIQQIYSSFDVRAHLHRERRLLHKDPLPLIDTLPTQPCQRGKSWQVDGVELAFIWPDRVHYEKAEATDKNAHSCVLAIHGTHQRALLTGDVGVAQEKQLLEAGLAPYDVVIVGHHGSRTSSSALWVEALQASVAVAQVGWWNRFNHPHPEVEQRWLQAGTDFYRTDRDGAVIVTSHHNALRLHSQRSRYARYWQNPFSRRQTKGNY